MVAELPNQTGLFFTTQKVHDDVNNADHPISPRLQAETYLWVMTGPSTRCGSWWSTASTLTRAAVRTTAGARRGSGGGSSSYRSTLQYTVTQDVLEPLPQAYNDRVFELLTRLGQHVRILFRVSCVPSVKENPASRLNDYFR